MANISTSLFLVTFLLGIVLCSSTRDFKLDGQKQGKTWCVAKVSATNAQMQAFLDANCGSLGCGAILPGGSCFEPNTVRNHASYAIDLYYRKTGECKSDIGTPSINDPSYGKCQYP
ncbi:Carbohydrate-binding X8 domain superfamily protein [Abeliophyllum distichum]|uniref:Carbohydrate-binding X8 domain superfamily protein n=1 Tax=Abeliophyllum distichum TaxID=126358 RepID=A0ABD1RRX9_9LAMI